MEAFVVSQHQLEQKINKSFTNFKKTGLPKMTKGAAQIRMQALEKLWCQFEKAHNDMVVSAKVKAKDGYFTADIFEQVQELFFERMAEFQDHLNGLGTPQTSVGTLNISQQSQQNIPAVSANSNIPNMPLPSFDGDYLKWSSFKNLFTAAISSKNLSDIEKMTFLMGCLKGEPRDLIVDQPVVEGNFNATWEILREQYENNRRVITILVRKMFMLEPMKSTLASEIKRIYLGITSPLATLKTLGRTTDKWDDLLVFLTVSKITSDLRKDWDDSLGDSSDPPKFQALSKFLKTKQQSLETYESDELVKRKGVKALSSNSSSSNASQSNNFSQSKGAKPQPIVNSFTTSVTKSSQKCCCCSKAHNVTDCQKFLSKPVGERHAIIKRARLCFNCLQRHKFGECKSQTVCSKCQRKHNELLHFENGGDKLASASNASSDHTTPQLNSGQLLDAAAHLVRVEQVQPETILLATAWVKVEIEAGSQVTARALIDQCSQSSFVSESLCQRLRLPRKPISLAVSELGSERQTVCKAITEFVIKPHFQSTFGCQVTAYVIPKISSYCPVTKSRETSWTHLQKITLADPHYHRTGVIDILLGAAVHARIVESRVLKGLWHEPIATSTQLGWIISGDTGPDASRLPTTPVVLHSTAEPDAIDLLQKFWVQEELQPIKKQTLEEGKCEQHFVENVVRLENGQYQVRLPFKAQALPSFQDTYYAALKLLRRMEAKFAEDEDFKNLYHAPSHLYH